MSHVQPIAGMTIVRPARRPQPGEVIVSYEIIHPQPGCCQCVGLSPSGWIAVILLLIFFPCLAFLPCLVADCFEPQQRPVYGYPGQQPGGGDIPVGIPVTSKQGMYPVVESRAAVV